MPNPYDIPYGNIFRIRLKDIYFIYLFIREAKQMEMKIDFVFCKICFHYFMSIMISSHFNSCYLFVFKIEQKKAKDTLHYYQ